MREQINGDEGDELVTLREENVRLRAEVEKMTNLYEVTRTDALRNGEDATRLKAENEKLRKMVRNAYNDGFNEGMREHTTHRGGIPWHDSKYRTALTHQEGER